MILFNNQVYISDKESLEEFCSLLWYEVYDEHSRIGISELIDYLHECYDADKRLYNMTQERIGVDIIPITLIEFSDTAILNDINFSIISEDKNREFTLREELIFKEICDICFGSIKGMFDRISKRVES